MDLPFAVEPSHSATSSLVTASSQGSFFDSTYALGPTIVGEEDDFATYVTVSEEDADEVDVVIGRSDKDLLLVVGNNNNNNNNNNNGDILAVLLSGDTTQQNNNIVSCCEVANVAAQSAAEAKKRGDMCVALDGHARAARVFRDAAVSVRNHDASLSNSLLLLSRSHAQSAIALERFRRSDGVETIIRGALGTHQEADISDSIFLGKSNNTATETTTTTTTTTTKEQNPVDDMMELERELRDIDMTLELGNSLASLGTRTRLKHSTTMEDGSFMVVPPSISSSSLWRKPVRRLPPPRNLESSWWSSQILTKSSSGGDTKQLVRLLDSIKALSDENAALLREVEELESARTQAKTTKEQMQQFKTEYQRRFHELKAALERFRKTNHDQNPVTNSDFLQGDARDEQLRRQEQLIRKLTADLKREKDEGKKKDAALRKYENFYREVKARSAEKARQRLAEQQRPQRRPRVPTR